MLGARVTFTDYVDDALRFAELNLKLNLPDAAAEFVVLDWRSPHIDRQYDLVLAADVAYEKRFFNPLYQTITKLLKPGGLCLLSEPGRAIAKDFLNGFTAAGFTETMRTHKVATLDEVSRKVGILGVRRSL
jgi:predicted nicotinamide N-methyase